MAPSGRPAALAGLAHYNPALVTRPMTPLADFAPLPGLCRAAATRRRPAAAARPAAPKTVEKPETDTLTLTGRPWNVIVHDDPVTLMGYVTKVFMDVFRYSQSKAHRLMMEVHTDGKSVVWTGPREQAETYVTKLQAFHLLATVEPSGE